MNKTVCFTGHREISDAIHRILAKKLHLAVESQILSGATTFRTGGALGFDTMAALCVLSMKSKHPHIRLELFLPYPEQAEHWSKNTRTIYEQILQRADEHRYICPHYFHGALQIRNRALVAGADVCIAYLESSQDGGTAYTSALALQNGLEWINLYDELQNANKKI